MPRPSNRVLCHCPSSCGPQGQLVQRSTRTRHMLMASSSSASTVREPVHDGGEDGGGGTIEALISAGNEDNSHFSALFDPLPFGSDAMEEDTAPVADSDLGASLRTPSSNQPLPSRNPGDQQSRRHWIVLFELLLLWLVASRSLSEKVCALLLDFLDGVARHLGDVRDDQSSRSTSGSGYGSRALAQRRSQLRSAQVKYYLCPDDSCWTPHSSVDSPRQCRKCGHDLFFDADFNAAPEQPRLVFHYDPIANWLEELLLRPGFEQQLNEWRSRPQTPGVYGDLYDGSWWKDKDASGSDFFTQNRLSISLALMIDWIKPFSRNGTSHYSCGVISLRIDNLPAHIRNHSHFTHVCCVLPGPKKPKAVALAAVMEILIVELRDLGTMGRRLQVHDHGQKTVDRLVRARVRRLMADTEARTLLAGFPHHSSSCQFCPWCTADQKTWLVRFFNGEQPVRRSSASHKSSAIRALSIARINPGSDRLDTIRKTEGATMTPLYSFPGWSSLEMAPVDVMHLLDLGLGRHTWMETLIGGKLLKGEELERSQEVLGETTYPSGLTRISPLLGNPSGGTPTSAGWSVLTRYLLPVLLVAAWRGLLLGSGVKTFSTTKRKLYARRDELDEEGQMIYVPFDDGGPNAHDENGPPPASMSSHANPSASGQPNSTGQSAAQFTREVRLINLLDATLQLAAASRLAHAHRLDAQQLMNLHEHLCTYVRIIATEINPAWTTYNFHIALHVADQIREHGPPRAYWSYPQERSYGIMKRVQTNRGKHGQLEMTIQSRVDDRHRIASLAATMPSDTLSTLFNDILNQGMKLDGHSELELEADNENPSSDGVRMRRTRLQMSPDDLAAVLQLASNRRKESDAPLTVFTHFDPQSIESVLGAFYDPVSFITVAGRRINRRTNRHSTSSDPSKCIIRTPTGRQLARVDSMFEHSYLEVTRKVTIKRLYAVVYAFRTIPWPRDPAMSLHLWQHLGYFAANLNRSSRTIIHADDILAPAITMAADYIVGRAGSVVAVPLV